MGVSNRINQSLAPQMQNYVPMDLMWEEFRQTVNLLLVQLQNRIYQSFVPWKRCDVPMDLMWGGKGPIVNLGTVQL